MQTIYRYLMDLVKDLRKLVASADCVIAPSISEWFGSVHSEAVAMGSAYYYKN